ncbi:hypothetical protein ACLBKU_13780 [Erythrobacter sp. NE805]
MRRDAALGQGHDREWMQAEREFLEDALGPALRAPAGAVFLS